MERCEIHDQCMKELHECLQDMKESSREIKQCLVGFDSEAGLLRKVELMRLEQSEQRKDLTRFKTKALVAVAFVAGTGGIAGASLKDVIIKALGG